MGQIEKVLNSHQELAMNESFEITIGTINLPKGSGRRPITSLEGEKNSIHIKKSIVTIDNDNQLCMARAIGVGWAKLNRCTKEEWDDLTQYQKSIGTRPRTLKSAGKLLYTSEKQNEKRTEKPGRRPPSTGRGTLRPTRELKDVEAFEEALDI